MYNFCRSCNGSGSGVIPDTDCYDCDGSGNATNALAKSIIIELDNYARGVHSLEYGLPIDPDTKWLGTNHGKAMIKIIETQLKRV